MARHRDNLSFYYTKGKRIFWSIEFLFWNDYEHIQKSNPSLGSAGKYIKL